MADLLVIVPSRGRPESVARMVKAWEATGAYAAGAELVFAVDLDDPDLHQYYEQGHELSDAGRTLVSFAVVEQWMPMVHKLNQCASFAATQDDRYFALAFMGDDHLPRSAGWSGRYLAELRDLGTGIVYGDDRIQGERLPTQWAMTSDIVRALGRMVPADVEHLYCDNAIADLGRAAECIRYLPDVVVEHCHPLAGRAEWDAGYLRVNSRTQYVRDGDAYQQWYAEQMAADVQTVRQVRLGDGG